MVELCQLTNEPLVGGVDLVRRESKSGPAQNPAYAGAVIRRHVDHLGDLMNANFATTTDEHDVTVCPADVINRPAPSNLPKDRVALGLGDMLLGALRDVARSLRVDSYTRQRRRR